LREHWNILLRVERKAFSNVAWQEALSAVYWRKWPAVRASYMMLEVCFTFPSSDL
jgi:hypothetical protein